MTYLERRAASRDYKSHDAVNAQHQGKGPGTHAMLSSLPDALLYHTLTFVDENDDARCARISKSWASLRRAWVVRRRGQDARVSTVAFAHDGSLLAVGESNYTRREFGVDHCNISVYDVATGDLLHSLPRRRQANCAAFSPIDSAVLVVGDDEPLIVVYNLATGASSILQSFSDFWDVNIVTYSPDASKLAFCREYLVAVMSIDGLTKVGKARGIARTPRSGRLTIRGAAFLAAGAELAVAIDTKVKCYDVATGELRREIEHHADLRIWTLAASPHGIVSAGGDLGKLALYDASTGRLQRELRPATAGDKIIEHSCFSPDGSALAAQNSDAVGYKRISIYDTETGELRREITRSEIIWAVAFSPDGKTLALGDFGGRAALYDVATGDLRRMRRQPQALPAPPTA